MPPSPSPTSSGGRDDEDKPSGWAFARTFLGRSELAVTLLPALAARTGPAGSQPQPPPFASSSRRLSVLLQHVRQAAGAQPSAGGDAAGSSAEHTRAPTEQLTARKDSALAVLERLREQSAAALRRPSDVAPNGPTSPLLASVSGLGDAMLRLINPPPLPAEPLPASHKPPLPSRPARAHSPVPGAPYGGRVSVEWCAELEFVYRLLSSEEIHAVLATADAAWDSTAAIKSQLAGNDKAVRDWIRDNYGDADESDVGSPLAEGCEAAPAAERGAAHDGVDADCSINPRLATGRMQRRWKRTGSVAVPFRAPSDGAAHEGPAAPVPDVDLELCARYDASLGAPHAPPDDGGAGRLRRWRARVQAADPTLSLFEMKRELADPLTFVLLALLEQHGLAEAFSIGFSRAAAFCAGLNAGYVASNPFHNELHATDVLFATHLVLVESRLVEQQGLSALEVLALLLAAVCHDFRHPGVSNAYLIASGDPLALVYNDRSVLENYHASETFKLMAAPERNLLHALEPKAARDVRQAIVRMILATDMAEHFATVTELVSTAPHVPAPAAKQTEDDSLERLHRSSAHVHSHHANDAAGIGTERLLAVILHAADISHPFRGSLSAHIEWAYRLRTELFLQGDMEREKRMPVSPMCDRECAKPATFPSSQVGFIDAIVHPLLEALALHLPALQGKAGHLLEARAYWLEMKAEELAAAEAQTGDAAAMTSDSESGSFAKPRARSAAPPPSNASRGPASLEPSPPAPLTAEAAALTSDSESGSFNQAPPAFVSLGPASLELGASTLVSAAEAAALTSDSESGSFSKPHWSRSDAPPAFVSLGPASAAALEPGPSERPTAATDRAEP